MKYEKPDGVIEIVGSGCCCPPGQKRAGMHTNSGTSWWRVNDGEWQRTRTMTHAMSMASLAYTCEEFADTMKGDEQ